MTKSFFRLSLFCLFCLFPGGGELFHFLNKLISFGLLIVLDAFCQLLEKLVLFGVDPAGLLDVLPKLFAGNFLLGRDALCQLLHDPVHISVGPFYFLFLFPELFAGLGTLLLKGNGLGVLPVQIVPLLFTGCLLDPVPLLLGHLLELDLQVLGVDVVLLVGVGVVLEGDSAHGAGFLNKAISGQGQD